jgi:NAD(P)-dependent dehydrogenase (short-subunit alcohol dehydrogenase family)
MTGDEWDRVIHTNLDGFFNVLHPLVMPMVRRRKPGRIVTIASVSGLIGNRGQTNYSAAKAGIIAATKSLALELAKREITVNCVAPGLIDTEMVSEIPWKRSRKFRHADSARPMKRPRSGLSVQPRRGLHHPAGDFGKRRPSLMKRVVVTGMAALRRSALTGTRSPRVRRTSIRHPHHAGVEITTD